MKGYDPTYKGLVRENLTTDHWLSINCNTLQVDARRKFCDHAENYVAEVMGGENTNDSGEADTILYDVLVDDLYVSVKSSSNARTARGCMARSQVKDSPLAKAIEQLDRDKLFTQVYLVYMPEDREINWYQTPIRSFGMLKEKREGYDLSIDNQGRLSMDSHDAIFGPPRLERIITLPPINVKLENVRKELIGKIKRVTSLETLQTLDNTLAEKS